MGRGEGGVDETGGGGEEECEGEYGYEGEASGAGDGGVGGYVRKGQDAGKD